jgi:hypothetical protein
MKLILLSVVAAAAVLFGSITTAEAGPRYSNGYRGAGYGGYSYRPSYNGYQQQPYYSTGGHCAQPYKVRTVEVNRYTQCRTAYDHCGRPYTYHVTVVTYCDQYSNGSTRTWSQTFS